MKTIVLLLAGCIVLLITGCQSPEERAMNEMDRMMDMQMKMMERMQQRMEAMDKQAQDAGK